MFVLVQPTNDCKGEANPFNFFKINIEYNS